MKQEYLDNLFAMGDTIARQYRVDNWQNTVTGLGLASRDKVESARFVRGIQIPDTVLATFYRDNALARKICYLKPEEMLRKGYTLDVGDAEQGSRLLKELEGDEYSGLQLTHHFFEGMTWGRLFGGALCVIGADDGEQDMSEPLREDRVRSLDWLEVIDRRYIWPTDYHGKPEHYSLSPPYGSRLSGFNTVIHRSRVIRFGGVHTEAEERQRLNGWDSSVIQATYDALRQNGHVWQSLEHLLTDSAQSVFTIKGLMQIIAGGKSDAVRRRFELVDMCRSIVRAVLLDSEGGETFERHDTSFTSAAELTDKFMMRMSSETDIPITLLFGRSPAGENATGESDFRNWYDRIQSDQVLKLRPKVLRLARLKAATMGVDPDTVNLEFNPLWQLTPTEEASRRKTVAETDRLYIDSDVVTPEEVAASRFRGEGYSTEMVLDVEARDAAAQALEPVREGNDGPEDDQGGTPPQLD